MPTWDDQADVIVVGSGAAGLSAAIEARQAHASVIVLEKMHATGGNTRISDGSIAAPGIELQKRRGMDDSPDLFYDDMLRAGLGLSHPNLVRTVADRAAEAVDWTIHALGVEYQDRLDRFGGHSVARCLTTRSHYGVDITRAQLALLRQMGVEVRTCCHLVGLVTDDAGMVLGVRLRSGYEHGKEASGTESHIRARRGVVLATGGYANDVPFRMLQNPGLNEAIESTNHRGATAEGLVAALAIGALPVHLSWIQMGPWGCPDERGYGRGASFASYSVYPAGIVVDPATGQRIVNEWGDRRQRCDAILKLGHACIGLVDGKGAAKADDSLQRALTRGQVRRFDDVGALAKAYGIPPGPLEATVGRYNQMAARGKPDEFGKPLERGTEPLDTAPFYAMRLWPKVHYTPGGVGINSDAQVIDLHGRPIPRLFAAGEVSGGVHGASRLGSCSLTDCIVFGRIAGQQAGALR